MIKQYTSELLSKLFHCQTPIEVFRLEVDFALPLSQQHAGNELGQGQVKVEVGAEVGVEVTNSPGWWTWWVDGLKGN